MDRYVHHSQDHMEKLDFISKIKELDAVESVSGIVYRIDAVNEKNIIGTRKSTLKEFKIDTDGLYRAYCDVARGVIPLTTTALRDYVNRTQSPALAIIMSLIKM